MNELSKRIFTSIILFLLLMSMFFFNYIFISVLLIASTIIWIEINGLFSKIFKHNHFKIACSILALFFIFYFFWLSINSLQSSFTKIILQYSILVCIMSDIGGFVFGKTFKGIKLTKISPNKTISGMIGAFIFSLSLIIFYYFTNDSINLVKYTIITLIISSSSQLGDIFISFLKRKAKVKNTSDILPGHGGLLDRLDGIIFGVPLGLNLTIIF